MTHHRSFIATAAAVLLALASAAAQAGTVTEYARVNQGTNAKSVLVAGATAGSRSATASQVYWYDRISNTYTSALGNAGTAVTVNNTALRAYTANTAATGPYENSLARMTQGSANYSNSFWSVDLGAGLLNSDVVGATVSKSSIGISDFGNAGSQTVSFDFKVGLWDGSQLTQASSLSQLSLSIANNSTGAANTGSVSYLGNNIFRFTETGGSGNTGTSLWISSAADGQFVRSFSTTAFAHSGAGSFAGDYVDLYASRQLTSPVPEPTRAGLFGLGLALVFVARRRTQA
jgi:hypothetical protein